MVADFGLTAISASVARVIKNGIVYGAPGTGKLFVGKILVLYAISQGLNVISTALMGVGANALGGKHLHEIFKLSSSDAGNVSPFCGAQMAIDKIKRNTVLLHAMRTLDVIFVDEAGQVSSEILCMIDIILRKCRSNSKTPFGGVHIMGTMDPSQLQPINALPFLRSTFMTSCFAAVELTHSVRAHGDVEFQRLRSKLGQPPDRSQYDARFFMQNSSAADVDRFL